jgi:spore germination protein GerM
MMLRHNSTKPFIIRPSYDILSTALSRLQESPPLKERGDCGDVPPDSPLLNLSFGRYPLNILPNTRGSMIRIIEQIVFTLRTRPAGCPSDKLFLLQMFTRRKSF